MPSCPLCGTDLYGYTKSILDKNTKGRKETGVACCPWCKWSGTGEKYIDLDNDDVRIPYRKKSN